MTKYSSTPGLRERELMSSLPNPLAKSKFEHLTENTVTYFHVIHCSANVESFMLKMSVASGALTSTLCFGDFCLFHPLGLLYRPCPTSWTYKSLYSFCVLIIYLLCSVFPHRFLAVLLSVWSFRVVLVLVQHLGIS